MIGVYKLKTSACRIADGRRWDRRKMAQLGRNDPCRCGSGKKYKRCCLPADQAAEIAALRAVREKAEAEAQAEAERERAIAAEWKAMRAEAEEELAFVDESNAVVEMIHAGRLDEAERAAHELIEHYPGATDGLERLGQVYQARGDPKRAAKYYRDALALAERFGFSDSEHVVSLRVIADRIDPPEAY